LGIPDLFLPNKISFDQKKFHPTKTKLFLVKKDFIRQKQNIFSENKILSGENKTFSGQKRFCPTKTKSFSGKKILSGQNKIFSGQKRFCPGETKLFLTKKDFVRPKQNLFCQEKIFSAKPERRFLWL
jgi:hypothetical protein